MPHSRQKRYLICAVILLMPSLLFGFLRTQGTQIVDANGNPVLLRGYGLGGWLVPEGYMLHVPGFGSPTAIRNLIVDLVGNSNADQFYTAYEANYVNQADIAQIAAWGFNSIRLPFHYNQLYDRSSGTFKESGFALFNTVIDWCRQYDLYVILDMHCAPGGQNDGNISDSDGILARLWTDQANKDLAILIWREIARRYVNEPVVGGYDLLNEPVLAPGVTTAEFRDFYVQATNAIRQEDTNHIVFIEGNWYATDFSGLTPPWDNNMVYSFHRYWSDVGPGTIGGYIAMSNQYDVPLWMGESGENSNHWYQEFVEDLESNGIGWCWWAHKKIDTITSPLSADRPANYQTVLNYWNGSGSRPSPTFAINALMEMADALRIENCTVRSGVIPALTDPDYDQVPVPFTNLEIPGIIPAVHYDHGAAGIGYIDSDFENNNGPGGATWNTGWVYRNDGVDIEASQDPQGHDYNVGWIESAERLYYTVNVLQSGTYLVLCRVASLNGGGSFRLFSDNVQVSQTVNVPATGGWQNWVTVQATNVELTAGTHRIMVFAVPGGFNLNQMAFHLVSDIDDQPTLPSEYHLAQNYPNPFNPTTNIEYQIPETGYVELVIYDMLGKKVRTLVSENKLAGSYQVEWDGRGDAGQSLAGGSYLYRLKSAKGELAKRMILLK